MNDALLGSFYFYFYLFMRLVNVSFIAALERNKGDACPWCPAQARRGGCVPKAWGTLWGQSRDGHHTRPVQPASTSATAAISINHQICIFSLSKGIMIFMILNRWEGLNIEWLISNIHQPCDMHRIPESSCLIISTAGIIAYNCTEDQSRCYIV